MRVHLLRPGASTSFTTGRRLCSSRSAPRADRRVASRLGAAPAAADRGALSFVPNAGQTDASVRFAAHTSGASFYFTRRRRCSRSSAATKGSRSGSASSARTRRPRSRDRRARARHRELPRRQRRRRSGGPGSRPTARSSTASSGPGSTWSSAARTGTLKYEFVVAARRRSEPDRARLPRRRGPRGRRAQAQLLIQTPWGTLRDEKPRTFQVVDGRRVPVESRFALGDKAGTYGFALGAYDASHPLVIDPGLLYSTYLGGNGNEEARNVAIGADGSTYVTGFTSSPDFPSTAGAFDLDGSASATASSRSSTRAGRSCTRRSSAASGIDGSSSIAVDAAGNAYVAGSTGSADFPTTAGAYSERRKRPAGRLRREARRRRVDRSSYSTYLGALGSDGGIDVALDAAAAPYVIGRRRAGFPTTTGAFDETIERAPGRLRREAELRTARRSSTRRTSAARSAISSSPSASPSTRTGTRTSPATRAPTDFPTTPGAFDTTGGGNALRHRWDAFVTKLNADGSGLAYSTYLSGEQRRDRHRVRDRCRRRRERVRGRGDAVAGLPDDAGRLRRTHDGAASTPS